MPNTSEFLDTNKEFFTSTYSTIRNPKAALKKLVTTTTNSRYYTAIDYGAKNLFQDLRTGKFYNKEREERDLTKFGGSMFNMDDFDDLSDFGVDSDWENNTQSENSDITAGDMKIVQSIESSNMAVANTTANAIVASANLGIKNSRANIGIMMNHTERLFNGIHSDISILNSTMDSIYKLTSKTLVNIDNNLAEYFSNANKLDTERNQILKEMLEMQRNTYKSA